MLRPKQLSIARVAFDAMLANAKNKKSLQVARLNGADETNIVTPIGVITLPWSGRISRKVPQECRTAPVPVDWDNAEESSGLLKTTADIYPQPDSTDAVYTVVETLKLKDTSGSVGLDVIVANKTFNFIVTAGSSIYLVNTRADGGRSCTWIRSRNELDNRVISLNKDTIQSYIDLFCLVSSQDPEARFHVSSHPLGAGVIHIISKELGVVISICMPNPAADGQAFTLNNDLVTSPLKSGTFERLINRKEEKMSNEPVSINELAAIANGIRKPEEITQPVQKEQAAPFVEVKQTVEDITTPTAQEEQVVTDPVEKQEATVAELLDALYAGLVATQIDFNTKIKSFKAVIPKYKAEQKAAKKNPGDGEKLRELQQENTDLKQQIKKLRNMLKAAME